MNEQLSITKSILNFRMKCLFVAVRVGFEPTVRFHTEVFKTSTINQTRTPDHNEWVLPTLEYQHKALTS